MSTGTLGPRSHLGWIDRPVFSLGGGDVLVDGFALELPLHGRSSRVHNPQSALLRRVNAVEWNESLTDLSLIHI